jgi:hypothetical protein
MLFNATFNNISVISWRSILLMEKIGVPRENHSMFMLSYIFVIVCSILFSVKANILFAYTCIVDEDPIVETGRPWVK